MSARPIGRSLLRAAPAAARRSREPTRPDALTANQVISALKVNGRPAVNRSEPDPFICALARYVEALDRRYPDGPDEMRHETLACRANIAAMDGRTQKGSAA